MKALGITVREHRGEHYQAQGPVVIVLHGGPAAAGSAAGLARAIAHASPYRVLEPFQRGSSDAAPLTVARHVEDLHGIVSQYVLTGVGASGGRPAIVGHSWGAMLALAYGAAHPDSYSSLVLVGSGTFDLAARAALGERLATRLTPSIRARLDELQATIADPDQLLSAMGRVITPAYGYDVDPAAIDEAICDARAHEQTWADMLRLQSEGAYPASFASIKAPVLMLHGADDPHPGKMIADSLLAYMPHLEFRELAMCGHSPWTERAAASDFVEIVLDWLAAKAEV